MKKFLLITVLSLVVGQFGLAMQNELVAQNEEDKSYCHMVYNIGRKQIPNSSILDGPNVSTRLKESGMGKNAIDMLKRAEPDIDKLLGRQYCLERNLAMEDIKEIANCLSMLQLRYHNELAKEHIVGYDKCSLMNKIKELTENEGVSMGPSTDNLEFMQRMKKAACSNDEEGLVRKCKKITKILKKIKRK